MPTISGKKADGTLQDVRVDALGYLLIRPADIARTAFGYQRVAVPNIELSGTFTEDERALEFETDTDGGGDSSASHSATTAAWTLTAGDTATDYAMLSSRRYVPYFAGHSQRFDITGAFGAAVAGSTKRMGYFDDNDGVFMEQRGDATYHLTVRTSTSGSPVDTNTVAQADWDDPMGAGGVTGDSGVTLTAAQLRGRIILSGDLQWLGTGDVRCYLEAAAGGQILIHTFHHAGDDLAVPYMKTAKLPARWHIVNVSASAVSAMTAGCCNVSREGGTVTAAVGTMRPGVAAVTATTTKQAFLHIRLASAFVRDELSHFSPILLNTGTEDVIWTIERNVTQTAPGGSWTSQGPGFVSEYIFETEEVTGEGDMIAAGYLAGGTNQTPGQAIFSDGVRNLLTAVADIAGTADVISLSLQAAANTSACFAGLSFTEQR